MRVIGVLDLLAGRAVHARAGVREAYEPVRAAAGSLIEPGDALALTRVYANQIGLSELYVADLDAILGRAPQDALVASVAACGASLWLDAGVSSAERARRLLGLGATRVVVGLETLSSFDALEQICVTVGEHRVAFSLDLRNGAPMVAVDSRSAGEPPHLLAARAAAAGAGAVIVLDLARVGTGVGLDLGLIARVREAAPGVTLVAGGGVRGVDDLMQLTKAGCDGALVATALHDGHLDARDVQALGQLSPMR